jgi:hypothetical protein
MEHSSETIGNQTRDLPQCLNQLQGWEQEYTQMSTGQGKKTSAACLVTCVETTVFHIAQLCVFN